METQATRRSSTSSWSTWRSPSSKGEDKLASETISHVIGTIALIGLFITASMTYTIYFSDMQEQASIAQLQGISDYVSAVILDIYSLGASSQGDQLLMKTLSIPPRVAQSSYNISLLRGFSLSGETAFMVLAKLTWKPSVYAESLLPWNGMDGMLSLSNGSLPQGITTQLFQPKAFVLSMESIPIIWYCKSGMNVTVGLGVES